MGILKFLELCVSNSRIGSVVEDIDKATGTKHVGFENTTLLLTLTKLKHCFLKIRVFSSWDMVLQGALDNNAITAVTHKRTRKYVSSVVYQEN